MANRNPTRAAFWKRTKQGYDKRIEIGMRKWTARHPECAEQFDEGASLTETEQPLKTGIRDSGADVQQAEVVEQQRRTDTFKQRC